MRGLGRFPLIYYPIFALIVGFATFTEMDGLSIAKPYGIASLVFVIIAIITYCIHKFGKNDKIAFIHSTAFGISLAILGVGAYLTSIAV